MSQKRLKRQRRVESKESVEVKEILPKFWDVVRGSWKFLLLITLLSIGLYANGMRGDFVSDDYATITQNPYIGDFGYTMNWDTFGNSMHLSNWLIYTIFGYASPIPYHIFSLLCFILFNIIAYVLVKLISKNDWVSKLTLLLFVVHPIHVEAVSWISGRIYLILGIYIMLSFINFVYYMDDGKYRHLIWSAVFFILAFSTDRPRPFGAILLMGLYLVYLGWKKVKEKVPTLLTLFGILVVVSLVVAIPYINTRISTVNSGTNASDSVFYSPFFQYPISIPNYLQLLLIPTDLTLYHTMYILPGWLNWSILLMYLVLVGYFYFKDKRYFWALSFIFVSIFPSMTPIKVSWMVAERYMFLGSLGFCWFLGLLISDHWDKLRIAVPTLFMCLMFFYAVKTYYRNIDWRTNHSLWVSTCQVSPNSHNAWNNIGDDYDKLGDPENAIKGFTQSVLVKPNYADAYHNRANIFLKSGLLDLARQSYEIALQLSPNLYQTYLSLTQIDLAQNKGEQAVADASKAVEMQPSDPQTHFVLGVVYAQIGKIEEAKKIFQSILSVYPDYQPALNAVKQLGKS